MSAPLDNPAEVEAGAPDALRRHVLTLADTKRILGIRYSDWLLGAPSIETGIATSSMAQDEWGHARLLYAMLKDFDLDPVEVEHEREPSEYTSIDALDRPVDDWASHVVLVVVVDGALTAALEGFAAGRYEQARARVPKMVSEEDFHRDLGHAWFRRLANGTDEARDRLRTATREILPRTLAWLEPDDEVADALAAEGLAPASGTLRGRFLDGVRDLLSLVDVEADGVEPVRDDWDADRRRGPGAPDAESVERARGDRNRALFVE